ncbi:extensin [Streptomyces phaeochromogenes]|uniref:Extensin n=1 Tax=Streptomyces phaeochromogenes TaxID=1923 RepID=A0ABZ1HEB5_STRPH|nr:extensin [Streptomyces phaeochromogenes]WSD15514.1 extensin [Streptomyces phaeochromogenes]
MADEQYRWLDRDTAERLLRGEPLDAVDADSRDQADRLTEALEALDALGTQTAESTPADAELPGEAAALAAFRKARTGKNGERASLGPRTRTRSAASAAAASSAASQISSDAGLIHLGRPTAHRRDPSRWGRPVRYGLAAALAAGMIGGAAMAATSGVLPFGGEEPEPGSSATVDVTPDRPLVSPSPEKKPGGGPDKPRPDGSAGGPTGKGPVPPGEARGGTDPGARSDPGEDRREGRPARGWRWLASVCRDFRDGKNLDSERRRGLEDAAKGAEQVRKYCKGVLNNWDDRDSGDGRSGNGSGRGESGRGGSGWNNDREGRDGRSNDEDDGDGDGDGSHIGAGLLPGAGGTVRPMALAPAARSSATRTPTPVRTLLQAPAKAPNQTSPKAPTQASTRALAPDAGAPTRPEAGASTRPAAAVTASPAITTASTAPAASSAAPARSAAPSAPATSAPARSTEPKATAPRAPRTPRALPALSSSS